MFILYVKLIIVAVDAWMINNIQIDTIKPQNAVAQQYLFTKIADYDSRMMVSTDERQICRQRQLKLGKSQHSARTTISMGCLEYRSSIIQQTPWV